MGKKSVLEFCPNKNTVFGTFAKIWGYQKTRQAGYGNSIKQKRTKRNNQKLGAIFGRSQCIAGSHKLGTCADVSPAG
jgi:hypothetical protein